MACTIRAAGSAPCTKTRTPTNLIVRYQDEDGQLYRERFRSGRAVGRHGDFRVRARLGPAPGDRTRRIRLLPHGAVQPARDQPPRYLRRRAVPRAEGHPRIGDRSERRSGSRRGAARRGALHADHDAGVSAGTRCQRRRAAHRRVCVPLRIEHRRLSSTCPAWPSMRKLCRTSSTPKLICTPARRTASGTSPSRSKSIDLNRVVVASCTPLTHQPLFQDCLRSAGLESVSVRDGEHPQPVFVGAFQRIGTWPPQKAKDLVRMAVGAGGAARAAAHARCAGPARGADRRRRRGRHDGGAVSGRTGFPGASGRTRSANSAAICGTCSPRANGKDPQQYLNDSWSIRSQRTRLITVHLRTAGDRVQRLHGQLHQHDPGRGRRAARDRSTASRSWRPARRNTGDRNTVTGRDPRIITQQEFEARLGSDRPTVRSARISELGGHDPVRRPGRRILQPHLLYGGAQECAGAQGTQAGRAGRHPVPRHPHVRLQRAAVHRPPANAA